MSPPDMAHFDRLEGFQMGRNRVTGPLCSALGIRLDGAFSIALVFKADLSSRKVRSNVTYAPVTLLRLYANTVTNNGATLSIDPATNAVQVRIGSNPPISSEGDVSLIDGKHYALVLDRDADATVKVLLADLSTATGKSFDILLQGRAPVDESETFSNREMAVNESGNWKAGRLLEVRIYDRGIRYDDIAAMRSSIQAELEERSPGHRRFRDAERRLREAQKCPFDAKTCAACRGIVDWMGIGAIDAALSGGPACVAAVAEFCGAHPEHPRCACWNAANPEYHGKCRNIRAAFGDKDAIPVCKPAAPSKQPAEPTRISRPRQQQRQQQPKPHRRSHNTCRADFTTDSESSESSESDSEESVSSHSSSDSE
jgi:hypothetical protein